MVLILLIYLNNNKICFHKIHQIPTISLPVLYCEKLSGHTLQTCPTLWKQ